jgi:hypothetical protein
MNLSVLKRAMSNLINLTFFWKELKYLLMHRLSISAFLVLLLNVNQVSHAHQSGAHVHGIAQLQVVLEGNQVSLEFTSPLENLLGFEHVPRTAKQKRAAQEMLEMFRKPTSLFVPTASALCQPTMVKLTSPVLGLSTETSSVAQTNDGGVGHAELLAEMIYTCQKPMELRGLNAELLNSFPTYVVCL